MYEELLSLARETMKAYFEDKGPFISDKVVEKYGYNGACFVTLTYEGELRGCIGSLKATRPLYEDVIENSVNALVNDPRFLPVDVEELDGLIIELSILGEPEILEHKDEEELLEKLDNEMGIVLEFGGRRATFLPQVWEQLPDKVIFLEELCHKAGLLTDDWKEADIYFYRVEKIKEAEEVEEVEE